VGEQIDAVARGRFDDAPRDAGDPETMPLPRIGQPVMRVLSHRERQSARKCRQPIPAARPNHFDGAFLPADDRGDVGAELAAAEKALLG
jgi:hypothetical protein